MSIEEPHACHCDWGLVECTECKGTGDRMCEECDGNGQVPGEWNPVACESCNGFGCTDCRTCNGTGYVACHNCELGESRRRIGE